MSKKISQENKKYVPVEKVIEELREYIEEDMIQQLATTEMINI